MTGPNQMDGLQLSEAFSELSIELTVWAQQDQVARLILRDDDAVEITPELIHLKNLTEYRQIPVLLAVIPKFVKSELGEFVRKNKFFTAAVHGYSHENHAGKREKKTELGTHRPIADVFDSLKNARRKMIEIFGSDLSKILVPPWNRIDADIAAGVHDLGFRGISGFGWKIPTDQTHWINTHVDIINWRDNSSPKSISEVIGELVENLKIARKNEFAPVGILTHHLVHSQISWHMLDEILEYLCGHQNVKWVNADELIINIDP